MSQDGGRETELPALTAATEPHALALVAGFGAAAAGPPSVGKDSSFMTGAATGLDHDDVAAAVGPAASLAASRSRHVDLPPAAVVAGTGAAVVADGVVPACDAATVRDRHPVAAGAGAGAGTGAGAGASVAPEVADGSAFNPARAVWNFALKTQPTQTQQGPKQGRHHDSHLMASCSRFCFNSSSSVNTTCSLTWANTT
jgi:hypothetical protein